VSVPKIVFAFSYNRFCSKSNKLYSLCWAIVSFMIFFNACLCCSFAALTDETICPIPETTDVTPPKISPDNACPTPVPIFTTDPTNCVIFWTYSPTSSPNIFPKSCPNSFSAGIIDCKAFPISAMPSPILAFPPNFILFKPFSISENNLSKLFSSLFFVNLSTASWRALRDSGDSFILLKVSAEILSIDPILSESVVLR